LRAVRRAGTGRELFVYWRLARTDLPAVLQTARAWQQGLMADEPQLEARLLVRVDEAEAEVTVMETYAVDGGDVGAPLQARIEQDGRGLFARWQRGRRHVEVFAPCPG